MDQELQTICDQFIRYRDELRNMNFFTSYGQLWPLCSFICIIRNQEPNEEIMDLCKKIIHERFGFLNYFRGNGEKVITTLLACESDPGAAADLCKEAYDILKDHFGSSNYLPMLAYYMATTIAPRDYAQFAQDSWNLYQRYNKMHPLMTSYEDVIFVGLLNSSKRPHEELVNETEVIWRALKDEFFWHKDAMQTAAMALTLCVGDPMLKSARFITLHDRLRDEGYRVGKGYDAVPLAILANLGIDSEQIMQDFVEAENALRESGKYGFWSGYSTWDRLMHTALVLSAYYRSPNNELVAAFIVSVLIDIAAQQAAAASAAS